MNDFDVVVIGSGPGGYVAAARAGQLGLRTALIEKEHLGGVCLNWGCIPTKSLLGNAEVISLISKGREFGFRCDNVSIDFTEAYRRSRSIVSRQSKRIALLLRNSGVGLYTGTGRLVGKEEVVIEPSGETLKAKNIIIGTGTKPRPLPGIPFDEKVLSYRGALQLMAVPFRSVIVGGGPIGIEFATLWRRYGAEVTVIEMMPRLLPLEDEEISAEVERQFRRVGIGVFTGARVERMTPRNAAMEVTVDAGRNTEVISAERVMISIGFEPNTSELGLEKLGVSTIRGYIDVDERMRTSVSNIFAIGDVTGKLGLAHVASAQGKIAAEAIAEYPTTTLDYTKVPRCIYGYPEVASVGLTEDQAREAGYEVLTTKCPFAANGKALAMGENFGFVKVVAESKGKRILGVHLVGAHVTELIAGPAAMILQGATAEWLGLTVHPHPTLSEALMDAAHAMLGRAMYL
jgi:dihydrolipoamide dehydrogenase